MISSPVPQPEITAFLSDRIAARDFPSAIYLVTEQGQAIFCDAVGNAVVEPYRIAASVNTIYDLASLTKPLITGLLCAMRIERGELRLDQKVSELLPEFDRTDKAAITIRQLLTHTSGMAAWRPLYLLAGGKRERVLQTIAEEPLECAPATRVVYSDLNFITLGVLIERLNDKLLHEVATDEIIRPLHLERTFFNPEAALQTGIAACELGNLFEQNTVGSVAQSYQDWRTRMIWGEVHDGNAYFLGGSAGHAGLFADAADTAKIATQCLAEQTKLLRAETCALFSTNMTEGLNEARSPGWQLAATNLSTAGPSLPPNSFGHTGFTGTSCWVDPTKGRVFVLLTNRTHVRELPFANINAVRRQFHTLAVEALDRK